MENCLLMHFEAADWIVVVSLYEIKYILQHYTMENRKTQQLYYLITVLE